MPMQTKLDEESTFQPCPLYILSYVGEQNILWQNFNEISNIVILYFKFFARQR